MEKENIEPINYCRKVRMYPSKNHKILLEKCFGATRYLINKTLEEIKKGNLKATSNAINIRNHLKYQDKYIKNTSEEWLTEIPYDTRDEAIRQLSSNFKTAFTQLKTKQITKFEMKFKSKKNPVQVCFVNKTAFLNDVDNKKLFVRRVKDNIHFRENIDNYKYGRLTIIREKGRYYMCFPLSREVENVKTEYTCVSLDPGVRTFQTFYSPEGLIGKLGNGTVKNLKGIFKQIDKLKSNLSTMKDLPKRTRYNMNSRCNILRTKVKNIVKDLHHKSASWLTTNFKYIFLPVFNTQKMVRKHNRNIHSSTVRAMMALSHYSFKQCLIHMAKSRGCIVNICDEKYTTKTCGKCGFYNKEMKSEEIYNCSSCNLIMDRDYNAARNIMIRNVQ